MGSAEAQRSTDAPPASIWEGVYSTFAEARGDAAFESQRWLDQIAAASQAPPTKPEGGETQQVIKPEPPRRIPGMLEGGPQPA